jgi:hypothetical protein
MRNKNVISCNHVIYYLLVCWKEKTGTVWE